MSTRITAGLSTLRSKLTYANILATVAMFVVLGGGAFAATKAAKNSVVSKSIKNGQVKSVDVKDNGLTGTDIDESTLDLPKAPTSTPPSGPAGGDLAGTYPNPTITAGAVSNGKLAANSVDSSKVADGSLTGADLANATVPGAKLSVAYQQVQAVSASDSNNKSVDANCPGGKKVLGGGAFTGGLGNDIVAVTEQGPIDNDTWRAFGTELQATGSNWTVEAWAICADID